MRSSQLEQEIKRIDKILRAHGRQLQLNTGVSPEAIAAVEAEVGLTFAEELKEFYTLSNGSQRKRWFVARSDELTALEFTTLEEARSGMLVSKQDICVTVSGFQLPSLMGIPQHCYMMPTPRQMANTDRSLFINTIQMPCTTLLKVLLNFLSNQTICWRLTLSSFLFLTDAISKF